MYKYQSFIYTFFIVVFSTTNVFSAEVCEFKSEIQECIDSDAPRSITDYVCIEGSAEEKTYQVILDKRFQEIDDQIEEYIYALEKSKGKYFGKNKTDHHVDGILDIHNMFASHGQYARQYQSVCNGLVSEATVCLGGSTTVPVAVDFFQSSTCSSLIETKLDIYEQVTYDILYLNKAQVKSDESKLLMTQERTHYDALIDLFNVNIGYIERMLQKWPSKIFYVHE